MYTKRTCSQLKQKMGTKRPKRLIYINMYWSVKHSLFFHLICSTNCLWFAVQIVHDLQYKLFMTCSTNCLIIAIYWSQELSFPTHWKLLIPISFLSHDVNIWYFKLRLFETAGWRDKGIRKSEFVAETTWTHPLLYLFNIFI